MTLFISLLISGLAATIIVVWALRSSLQFTASAGEEEIEQLSANNEDLDIQLQETVEQLEDSIPETALAEQQAKENLANSELEAITKQHHTDQLQLHELQGTVAQHEDTLLLYKNKNSESQQIADTLRSNAEAYRNESNRLQGEINQSSAQLETLGVELELTEQQAATLQGVQDMLKESVARLKAGEDEHRTAAERFLQLQDQYRALEEELARLIEKQLERAGG